MARENSRLSIYGCRNAIIGCCYGKWKLITEPDKTDTINVNLYFDEDAHDIDEKNIEKLGQEIWTGEGEFIFLDFVNLLNF